jgi:hypothetical protein
MKWDCDRRERERVARFKAKLIAESEWHDVFAWLPVRVADGDCRWLETIQRRLLYPEGIDCALRRFSLGWSVHRDAEYKAKSKVNAD